MYKYCTTFLGIIGLTLYLMTTNISKILSFLNKCSLDFLFNLTYYNFYYMDYLPNTYFL